MTISKDRFLYHETYQHPTQPSKPMSLLSTVMDSNLTLHPLLSYSQHDLVPGNCAPIIWDLREPPKSALHVDNHDKPLSPSNLSQHATNPPCLVLRITCDIFPEPWPIEVRRLEPVTVGDVLQTIHSVINRRIIQREWDQISEKQRGRIGEFFDNRCRVSLQPEECRKNGVLRVDCLLSHTLFAGLSSSTDEDASFIMTLRRPQ